MTVNQDVVESGECAAQLNPSERFCGTLNDRCKSRVVRDCTDLLLACGLESQPTPPTPSWVEFVAKCRNYIDSLHSGKTLKRKPPRRMLNFRVDDGFHSGLRGDLHVRVVPHYLWGVAGYRTCMDYFTMTASIRRGTVWVSMAIQVATSRPWLDSSESRFDLSKPAKAIAFKGYWGNAEYEMDLADGELYDFHVLVTPHVAITPEAFAEQMAPMFDRLNEDPMSIVWKSGRCCICNRPLTDDQSRAAGIGPECYKSFSDVFYRA